MKYRNTTSAKNQKIKHKQAKYIYILYIII